MGAEDPLPPLPEPTAEILFPPNRNYRFFDRAARHPFRPRDRQFNVVNAAWLADAALLTYDEPAYVKEQFARVGMTLDATLDGSSTRAYVASADEFVIVAFRGTQALKRGGLANFSEVVADWLTDCDCRLTDCGERRLAHAGFVEGLQQIWTPLEAELAKLWALRPGRTLWLTGHSLGGALATLAADRLGRGECRVYLRISASGR